MCLCIKLYNILWHWNSLLVYNHLDTGEELQNENKTVISLFVTHYKEKKVAVCCQEVT